jgi:hypothetical protein
MKNFKFNLAKLSALVLLVPFISAGQVGAEDKKPITGVWRPLPLENTSGIMGKRFELYRNIRAPYLLESGFLIGGFENRPGTHSWQGEHIGKYIHTVVMDYLITKDPKTKNELDDLVKRLIATQMEDGYLGTYHPSVTFMKRPESGKVNNDVADDMDYEIGEGETPKGGWDVWTFRYNLHGLLFYENHFPNEDVVTACKKMGDLLIRIYGPGKYNLTKYGSRKGISAATLLESIVMLYERTKEKKYLDFAEHIVSCIEENPNLDITNTIMNNEDVVHPGEGKAYQLMSTLLGYYRLYLVTHNEKYLDVFEKSWEVIKEKHLTVAGGPWTRMMDYNANQECFANKDAFYPGKEVTEGCSSMSWIQMSAAMYELTGDPKYIKEAAFNFYNESIIHQDPDGAKYSGYTKMNRTDGNFKLNYSCCASSIPRGMYAYAATMIGHIGGNLIIGSLSPFSASLTEEFGEGTVNVESAFPYEGKVSITLSPAQSKSFPVELVIPKNTSLKNVTVNGKLSKGTINERGNYEIKGIWKKGDTIALDTQYQLKAHTQRGEDSLAWVAFTYGPIALAQKTLNLKTAEPFMKFKEVESTKIVNMLVKSPGSKIAFTVKGTDITFIPIWETANEIEFGGTKTYFGIEGNPNEPQVYTERE